MAVGDVPDLDDAGGVIGDVEFLVFDVIAGEHALEFPFANDAFAAGGVFVIELAFEHPGVDFEGAMGMPGESVVRARCGSCGR